jgi:hypothetical protein
MDAPSGGKAMGGLPGDGGVVPAGGEICSRFRYVWSDRDRDILRRGLQGESLIADTVAIQDQ